MMFYKYLSFVGVALMSFEQAPVSFGCLFVSVCFSEAEIVLFMQQSLPVDSEIASIILQPVLDFGK
jgi:hypothetical protein